MCQATLKRLSNRFESCQAQKVASLLTEALGYRHVDKRERTIHDLDDLLGIELLPHHRRVDYIRKQNCHKSSLAFHRTPRGLQRGAAIQAEPRPLWIGSPAVGAGHARHLSECNSCSYEADYSFAVRGDSTS